MTNLKHELTVDDLIVEYMIVKVENGYEPCFLTAEFIDFLKFFESKMKVIDALYEGDKLFQRFMERKIKKDWYNFKIEAKPHMEMEYSKNDNDYLIKANYILSNYDRSVINTYFWQETATKVRSIIKEYLSSQPKRKIDETIITDESDLIIGKCITAQMVYHIWLEHIKLQIERQEWPSQCKDINRYLLEFDLAEFIGLKSIKTSLVDLYNVISKRLAILYHQDRCLELRTYVGSYLAHANYRLLIENYEKLVGIAFGPYNKSLHIDLSTLIFRESHEIDDICDWDDDPDIKVTDTPIKNDETARLVRNLEKCNQNK